jgi:hypothetical protein
VLRTKIFRLTNGCNAEARNYIAENSTAGFRSDTRRSAQLVFEHSNVWNWPTARIPVPHPIAAIEFS